jgi:hypothetical protein
VPGTSGYGALANLLNEVGGRLSPTKPTVIVTGLFYPKAGRQTRLFE